VFETIAAHLQALPLAVQLVALMIVLGAVDFLFAVISHLKQGDFHGTLFADWITSKGLPIVTVAILYGLDGALGLVQIDVGDTNLGVFGTLAYAQAITFIAQEAFSIVKNAKLYGAPPVDQPVPEE
jgi:hypothetical protein